MTACTGNRCVYGELFIVEKHSAKGCIDVCKFMRAVMWIGHVVRHGLSGIIWQIIQVYTIAEYGFQAQCGGRVGLRGARQFIGLGYA